MDNQYTREDTNDHEITLHMVIPAESFMESYNQLLADRSEKLDLKGFRKGKVPSDLIEPQFEPMVLAETFEMIAPYYVNGAIIKENLQPVAPPEYKELGELKKGEDVKFDVVITIIPKFTLGDLSKIKIKDDDTNVTDEEIQQTLETMYKNNADEIDKEKKPKLDDTWAKSIGTLYGIQDVKSLDDLKDKLKEMMADRKESLVQQERATKIINEAVKISGVQIPEVAIKYEAEQREESFNEDFKNASITIEDFLKERGVTLEEMKEMWMKDAKEALENDALLKVYAEQKDVKLSDKEFEEEIKKIKTSAKAQYEIDHAGHNHESNFDESVYDDPNWQAQIRNYMLKQKAFEMLLEEVDGVKGKENIKTEGKSKPKKKGGKSKNSETKKGKSK